MDGLALFVLVCTDSSTCPDLLLVPDYILGCWFGADICNDSDPDISGRANLRRRIKSEIMRVLDCFR